MVRTSSGTCRLSNQITLTYPTRSSFSRSLSKLNPKENIAKLKDAGRRVREHLQRPTLERSLSVDPLFRDEESDDIMRPSIITGSTQMAPPLAQTAIQEAEPSSSVTFQDTPVMLGGHNDEALSGSEGDTLPSISEVNMLQAPSPMYRRYASFTATSTFAGPGQPTQASPLRSPFDNAQQAVGPSAEPVLSDRPILSPFAEPPAAARRFSRQRSGKEQAFPRQIPPLSLCQNCVLPLSCCTWQQVGSLNVPLHTCSSLP